MHVVKDDPPSTTRYRSPNHSYTSAVERPAKRQRKNRCGPRNRAGCSTCRSRKVKCGEEFEEGVGCLACQKLELHCGYLDNPSRPCALERSPDMDSSKPFSGAIEGVYPRESGAFSIPTLNKIQLLDGNMDQAQFYPAPVADNQSTPDSATIIVHSDPDPNEYPPKNTEQGTLQEFFSFLNSSQSSSPKLRALDVSPTNSLTANSPVNQEVLPATPSLTPIGAAWPENLLNGLDKPATDYEKKLILYFLGNSSPPTVVSVDVEWATVTSLLLELSKHSKALLLAIYAFADLHSSKSRHRASVPAFDYYRRSCEVLAYEVNFLEEQGRSVQEDNVIPVLATAFFLAYYDLVAQPDRSKFYAHLNLKLAHKLASLSRLPKRGLFGKLVSWLSLLDAMAHFTGGDGLFLTDKQLDVTPPAGGLSEADKVGESIGENGLLNAAFGAKRNQELLANTINHPGLCFFMKVQQFIIKIGKLDGWHRSRGTMEDECEVLKAAQEITRELDVLWKSRPLLLDAMSTEGLDELLSPSIAEGISQNYRTYIASFEALTIYLHRIAYRPYPKTRHVEHAIRTVIKFAQINARVGEGLSSSMLWPLFFAGAETGDLQKREWIISEMNKMSDFANASRTATLLKEVIRKQDEQKERIDARIVQKELFGVGFAII